MREDLVRRFYEWERFGRGWMVWPHPVGTEPPFARFPGHLFAVRKPVDDGKKPGLVSFFRSIAQFARVEQPLEPELTRERLPIPAVPVEEWVELVLSSPPNEPTRLEAMRDALASVGRVKLSYEIVSDAEKTTVAIAVPSSAVAEVEAILRAFHPRLSISRDARLLQVWPKRSNSSLVIDLGLLNEFMVPLKSGGAEEPLVALFASLENLRSGECLVFQVLFEQAIAPWSANIVRATTFADGSPFFDAAPSFDKAVKDKLTAPFVGAVLRLAIKAQDSERVLDIARSAYNALTGFISPEGNGLIPLENLLDDESREEEVCNRRTQRSGMLLNLSELVLFTHTPGEDVRSSKLWRNARRSKAAPTVAAEDLIFLGTNSHAGDTREVCLSTSERLRHMHVIGGTGTGKSTLLLNCLADDIEKGRGVALLDPHGDLVEQALRCIPEHRVKDVVVFDPSDEEYAVGFNALSAHSALEKTLIASDLTAIFARLSTSWGDQMTSILANGVLAFLESKEGGTLLDLRRFLLEPDYRERFLQSVEDEEVHFFWKRQFPLLKGSPVASVLTRLDVFLRPKPLRYIVAQRKPPLDLRKLMDTGGIFLAKLSEGLIGAENAWLLGALLMAKLQQAAMSRQSVEGGNRRPFFIYLDEFHHFATPSLVSMLSGARKYGVGLVLAHQELKQLEGGNGELLSATLSNPAIRAVFRVGDADAKKLADGFSDFQSEDLQSLGTGEAICRIGGADRDFNLKALPPRAIRDREFSARILEASRNRYARRRTEIEEELREYWKAPTKAEKTEKVPPAQRVTPPADIPIAIPLATLEEEPQEKPLPPPTRPVLSPEPEKTETGKGGTKHRYLQQLIRTFAQGFGYMATVEKQLTSGGQVDVALEKQGSRIACEISVTTPTAHEAGNVKKCVEAGFILVAVIAPDGKRLAKIEREMRSLLSCELLEKVRFFAPEQLLAFIEEKEVKEAATEKTVRGYKVKVNYECVEGVAREDRAKVISKALVRSVKLRP